MNFTRKWNQIIRRFIFIGMFAAANTEMTQPTRAPTTPTRTILEAKYGSILDGSKLKTW